MEELISIKSDFIINLYYNLQYIMCCNSKQDKFSIDELDLNKKKLI